MYTGFKESSWHSKSKAKNSQASIPHGNPFFLIRGKIEEGQEIYDSKQENQSCDPKWETDKRRECRNADNKVKRDASPGSMHNTGCLGLVHWDDPEGWCGEGGGFRMGNTCIPVVDSF